MEKINKYDYNKMIEYFKFHDALDKLRKSRIKKVKTANDVYKRNVSEMRTRKEEAENKRIQEIRKEMAYKNKLIELNKSNLKKGKEDEMIKTKTEREKMNRSARCNFDNHFALTEQRRLLEEQRTHERMQAFKDKYLEVSVKKKNDYINQRLHSLEKYEKQHKVCLEREASTVQIREENRFNKFYQSFWNNRERLKKLKEKRKKVIERYERVAELKEENECKDNKKKKQIMKKIDDITIKCKLLEIEKQRKMEANIMEDNKRQADFYMKAYKQKQQDNVFRLRVLEYQREIVGRSVKKDNDVMTKKSNSMESTVMGQMEFERMLPKFSRIMSNLKEQSIMKKDWDKRKKVYKELIRVEQERQKKEAEEKLSKQ